MFHGGVPRCGHISPHLASLAAPQPEADGKAMQMLYTFTVCVSVELSSPRQAGDPVGAMLPSAASFNASVPRCPAVVQQIKQKLRQVSNRCFLIHGIYLRLHYWEDGFDYRVHGCPKPIRQAKRRNWTARGNQCAHASLQTLSSGQQTALQEASQWHDLHMISSRDNSAQKAHDV